MRCRKFRNRNNRTDVQIFPLGFEQKRVIISLCFVKKQVIIPLGFVRVYMQFV